MTVQQKQRDALRGLAEQIHRAALLPIQEERRRLWRLSNALRPERPMVAANPQHGWMELVPEDSLVCPEGFWRDTEREMRRIAYRALHLHDDVPIEDCVRVPLVIRKSDCGVENRVTKPSAAMGAYHIEPAIESEADLDKLHPAAIVIDRAESERRREALSDAIGDILPVAVTGVDFCRCGLTRMLIHLRGLEEMMYDLYDNPALIHRLMAFLRDEQLREFAFYEKEGVLTGNTGPYNWLGTGSLGYTDALDCAPPATMAAMSAWGESQETGSVGPAQFDEFVLTYQLPILRRFGLVEYGCCESLDTKFDLLIRKIPNLRWLAVSPWCDRRRAAEKLGRSYVYVYKPVPTPLASEQFDLDFATRQLRETLDIAKDNVVHIVMKDTSTFQNQPWRIGEWTKMARRLVNG